LETDHSNMIRRRVLSLHDISAARLRFYRSYGFIENPFPHIHPAYRSEYPDHSLVVLSTGGEMTGIEYDMFASDLNTIVMKKGMQ